MREERAPLKRVALPGQIDVLRAQLPQRQRGSTNAALETRVLPWDWSQSAVESPEHDLLWEEIRALSTLASPALWATARN